MVDEWRHPSHPWLTRDSVNLLSQLLRKEDQGIEFGSGRSTAWFLSKVSRLLSVESDGAWYSKVTQKNSAAIQTGRLDYRLAKTLEEYTSILSRLRENSLDFALVDGKFRDLCAFEVLPKLKPGALLIVDNINLYIPCDASFSPDSRRSMDGPKTPLWGNFLERTRHFRYVWTSNCVSDTAIWIKV